MLLLNFSNGGKRKIKDLILSFLKLNKKNKTANTHKTLVSKIYWLTIIKKEFKRGFQRLEIFSEIIKSIEFKNPRDKKRNKIKSKDKNKKFL